MENMETMDDYEEATVLEPELTIPAAPSTRLTDNDHRKLRTAARLPLGVFIAAIIAYVIGIINLNLIPAITTITLILAALTMLSAGILLILVFKARTHRRNLLQQYAETTIPLLEQKYGVKDLTPDLLMALTENITLTLFVNNQLRKTRLVTIGDSAVLMVHNTDTQQ